jgi:hypothetical protein
VFRCTTAGTASTEPAWPTGNNATITTGGATFTNVTGQSTYFWTAAAGDHQTLNGTTGALRFAAGDRVFISSDHAETVTSGTCGPGSTITQGYGLLQFLSVNRAGSTPPVAADMTAGATITGNTGTMIIRARVNAWYNGIAFIQVSSGGSITFNDLATTIDKTAYYQNCSFYLNNTGGSNFAGNSQKIIFDNTTLRFGATTQAIQLSNAELIWLNTPSALAGAIFPTTLFSISGGNIQNTAMLRGVDLSAITGTLFSEGGNGGNRYLFDSCRIASAATRYALSGSNTTNVVEYVNCFDGTSIISESWQPAGAVTTERTITLSGGATDDVGTFSHKMVSGTNVDKYNNPLTSFWMDVELITTGAPRTATVELISSAALNNDEISLLLEYQGTAGSSLASMVNSLPNVLATAAAVTTSTATWNSLPATPVRQHIQMTFTPQVAGRVRGQLRLGKASTTVYYNPQIIIT